MNGNRQRELDRNQWRNLVRTLCNVQTAGYPGAVSVSKRFTRSDQEEINLMAEVAGHIAAEYRLSAEVMQKDDLVSIRVTREPVPDAAAIPATPALPQEAAEAVLTAKPLSRRAPLMRLLQMVHVQSREPQL